MVVTPDSPTLPRGPPRRRLRRCRRGRCAASPVRRLRRWLGVLGLLVAVGYLAAVVDLGTSSAPRWRRSADRPAALLGAVVLYAGAFAVRSWAWRRVLPGLPSGQSLGGAARLAAGQPRAAVPAGRGAAGDQRAAPDRAADRRRWPPPRSRCGRPTCSPCSRSRRSAAPAVAGAVRRLGLACWPRALLAAGVAAVRLAGACCAGRGRGPAARRRGGAGRLGGLAAGGRGDLGRGEPRPGSG